MNGSIGMNLFPDDGRLFYKLYLGLAGLHRTERLHVLDEPVADAKAYDAAAARNRGAKSAMPCMHIGN